MISPQGLPAPIQLKPLMQSLAALDAIYSPEWDYRYYSFNSNWGEVEEMGSVRNGSGDTVFVLFNSQGCFIKGFAHEYPVTGKSADDYYAGIPQDLIEASREPAFSPNNVSFCCWRKITDQKWLSAIPDGSLDPNSFFLIQALDEDENSYQRFAAEYYEIDAKIEHISSIYKHTPMTQQLAESMNEHIEYSSLVEDLHDIGYPVDQEPRFTTPKVPPNDKGFLRKLFGG